MRTPFRHGNRLFSLAGQLLIFPALKDFIADVFGYGWDRNRAIDSKGNHNNALMGGYLLAASNTVIAIAGILTTDTIKALTKDGFVGSVAVNGTISFSTGLKYGAFEVYRGNLRIGRYCLTERQGLQIINQVTGGLPNGLLGGTTTTVWQKSNAFYCETNHTGYSISGTGWVTSGGAALTVCTIIPADPLNPTKCMAWVSSVQQDLQFIGKARNSVSVVPLVANFNGDRWYNVPQPAITNATSYFIECIFKSVDMTTESSAMIYGYHGDVSRGAVGRCRQIFITDTLVTANIISIEGISYNLQVPISTKNVTLKATLLYNSGTLTLTVVDVFNSITYTSSRMDMPVTLNMYSADNVIGAVVRPDTSPPINYLFKGQIFSVKEGYGGVSSLLDAVLDQYSTNYIDVSQSRILPINGISLNLHINIDGCHNAYNQTGYELWYNGADYRIYSLASNGTRITTPAGYTLVETVTAGNMPSVADSRMSTFKYALANSYALRQSVTEAYDATDPCAPKLLTYSELSALTNNIKVIKTEANGKITNLTIRQ